MAPLDPIQEALTAAAAERDRLDAQLTSAKHAEQLAIDALERRNQELLRQRNLHLSSVEAARVRLRPLEFRREAELGLRLQVLRVAQEAGRGVLGTAAFVGWLMAGTRGDFEAGTLFAFLGVEIVAVWWLGNKANHEEQTL